MGLFSPKTKEAFKGALDKMDGSKLKLMVVNVVIAAGVWIFVCLNFAKQIMQPFYRL
jgi:hypothetical protein